MVHQFITFRLADQVLMSPLSMIEEVADPLPVTAIADTHSWFIGLASKKGRLLPVSDLGDYAIKQPSRYESRHKWLIITRESESFGLIVDELIGLTEVNQSPVEVWTETERNEDVNEAHPDNVTTQASVLQDSPLAPLVTRVIRKGEEYAPVVDLGRLLTQRQFIQVGRPESITAEPTPTQQKVKSTANSSESAAEHATAQATDPATDQATGKPSLSILGVPVT